MLLVNGGLKKTLYRKEIETDRYRQISRHVGFLTGSYRWSTQKCDVGKNGLCGKVRLRRNRENSA